MPAILKPVVALAALAWPVALSVLVVEPDVCEQGAEGGACAMTLLQHAQVAQHTTASARREAQELRDALAAHRGGAAWSPKFTDMNGRMCVLCDPPLPERTDRNYTMRTDCGNLTGLNHMVEVMTKPLVSFKREATEELPETNAWCEFNMQKVCADSLYNKDFLYQAKAVDYPRNQIYDPWYCHYNGWLAPEVVALQHDFEGLKKKSAEVCASSTYLDQGWNSTMTLADMMKRYSRGMLRGKPTEQEAKFIGAWTCAMGSSGCDMAYCAYSFCDKGNGTFGMYEQCAGWHPKKGMPLPAAAEK